MIEIREAAANAIEGIKESAGFYDVDREPLSEGEKEKIIEMITAMRGAELQLIADIIPVQFCHNRIGKELKNAKDFKKSVKKSLVSIEKR